MEQFEVIGLEWKESGYVFHNADGRPLSPDTVSHAFNRLIRKAGVQTIRFHDLRHTHATVMLKQGLHSKIVSERLGHSSVSITFDTYSHVLPSMQQSSADAFDAALKDIPARLETEVPPKSDVTRMSPIMDFQKRNGV